MSVEGAFLFEISNYTAHPFHVCFGGCCVDLDFAASPGCVTMRYVDREAKGERGHLLARFADDVVNIMGPRQWMKKEVMAWRKGEEGGGLPYAVIGARIGGRKKRVGGDQVSSSHDVHPGRKLQQQGQPAMEPSKDAESIGEADEGGKMPHDYFDDVTVPVNDS